MSDAAIDVFPVSASFVAPVEPAPSRTHAWKDGSSFSFHDLLDTINPLQHIPVVSALYRWITGDTPGNVARIVGDTLFGGPLGLAAGAFSVALKEETGKDPGELMLALVSGPSSDDATAQIGAADQVAPPQTEPLPASAAAPPAAVAAPAPPVAVASPAAAAAPPAARAIPFTADAHPPIPLVKGAPPAVPTRATSGAPSAAEQAFLAQNAFFQRAAQRQSMTGRPITAPVPLQLTGQVVRGTGHPAAIPPLTVSPSPAPAAPLPGAAPSGPVDVPQRMLDALDKYMQLQQKPKRGGEVDLAP